VAGPLARELPLGGAAKLIEDQGKKALRRRQVAVRCGSHQLRGIFLLMR
jgi:hypothetical protein